MVLRNSRPAASAAAADRTGPLRGGRLRAAARTDRGGRPHNEDAFVCRPDLGLFAVIDGMGGQQAGETAAATARAALLRENDGVRGLAAANEEVHRLAESRDSLRGMGCVASVLRVVNGNGQAEVAHVGDTRVYVAHGAGCEQLTRDHTLAARRQEDLGIDMRTARGMGGHNQVTRDIGGQPRDAGGEWIDRLEVPLEAGDVFLLCSDGLHGAVPADELFTRLRGAQRENVPPEELVEGLVDLALQRGTRDNVTVVVVRAEATADDETTAPVATRPRPRPRPRRLILLLLLLAAAAAAFARFGDGGWVRDAVERTLSSRGW
jgi:serine/threonine protein phosphatase PrpC